MEAWQTLILFLGGLIALMLSGLPIAFAFLLEASIVMYMLMGGESGLTQLILSIYDSLSKFNLTPIPFFALMGEVLFHSGLAKRTLNVIDKWIGAIPGRLSIITTLSGGLFAALSGSAVANTSMLGSLMVPEMIERGYSKEMTLGPIMSSGAIAMIIPPSALAVLLGTLAEISISQLLIGAVLPGLLILFLYLSYIVIRCIFKPSLAPGYAVDSVPMSDKVLSLFRDLVPMAMLILAVLGVMFFGVATPTEAAALGALGSFLLTLCYKRFNAGLLIKSISGASKITVLIFAIIAGSSAFSQILAFSGATSAVVQTVLGLVVSPMMVLISMMVIVVVMGFFLEQVSIMMITIPIFMPLIQAFDINAIWFGILMLICLEIGQLSPPFGLVLFVMKGVAPPGVTMKDIYLSCAPYCLLDLLGVAILLLFPAIVTWLPGLIRA